jgi:hypothetical protein
MSESASSPSSESSAWEAWKEAVWKPFPEGKYLDVRDKSFAYSFDFAARPIDPRLIPFAITKNAAMVPTLVQNLRDYCHLRSPADFEADPANSETVERARIKLESTYDFEDNFTNIFRFPLLDLLSSLGIPINSALCAVKSVGVDFSCRLVKDYYADNSTLFAVDDLCPAWAKCGDAYGCVPKSVEKDSIGISVSDSLNKIHLMAESRRVFDPEEFKFTCIRKEDSLVIRVRQLKISRVHRSLTLG